MSTSFYEVENDHLKSRTDAKDAKTILEEERNGIFRVFDVGKILIIDLSFLLNEYPDRLIQSNMYIKNN